MIHNKLMNKHQIFWNHFYLMKIIFIKKKRIVPYYLEKEESELTPKNDNSSG